MEQRVLDGKVALVTGAGSNIGLGRAMTLALVRAGARVAMMDVDADSLERSADDARGIGGKDCVTTIVGDVTKPEDGERAVRTTIAELGGFHIMLNNAGINPRVSPGAGGIVFSEIPPDAWARTMAVNVNGPFFMARAAVPHLVAQGWGRITVSPPAWTR
jgi:NAD(P)-dependent dehydrogenase (short-subunit alcohol dehydrogenase family)